MRTLLLGCLSSRGHPAGAEVVSAGSQRVRDQAQHPTGGAPRDRLSAFGRGRGGWAKAYLFDDPPIFVCR